jgi:hypothetical protein
MTTFNGDIGLSQNTNGRQTALIIRQPRYVHAFTYTKSCSLDSRKTLTDNDSDTVGLLLGASEIGFPPAVQRLADAANTTLLPAVVTVKYAGAFGLYSQPERAKECHFGSKINMYLLAAPDPRYPIRLRHNVHSEQTSLRRGQRLLQRLP